MLCLNQFNLFLPSSSVICSNSAKLEGFHTTQARTYWPEVVSLIELGVAGGTMQVSVV